MSSSPSQNYRDSKHFKVSPEKSRILSCDNAVRNERYVVSGHNKTRLKKKILQLGSMCTWAKSRCKGTKLGIITLFSGAMHVTTFSLL